MAPRVLLAGFSIEANSFVDGETSIDDFRAQTFAVNGEIHRDLLGPTSELAGAFDVLERTGCAIVPAVVAAASPGPPVSDAALSEIVERIVRAADDVDGAYVMLHGSAIARSHDDPEGLVLAALRERLGPDRPIAISLDHHAYLTSGMVAAVDVITAYRTCPHTDLYERGAQATTILNDALRGRVRPVCAMAWRPMITPPDLHDSDREPFAGLMQRCDELERRGALAAALLTVNPWIDVSMLGWASAVTCDGDVDQALGMAEELVEAGWATRAALVAGVRLPLDDALRAALAQPLPTVLADSGDATNGGSPGDSTELLRAALSLEPPARVLLSVCDPQAAPIAFEAGVGASVALALGRGGVGDYNETVVVRGLVESTFEGEIRYTHPAANGQRDHTGRAALVRGGKISIVVHSRPVRVIDAALYEALGASLASFSIIQAKSHISFRAGFDRLTSHAVVAATKGPTTGSLDRLPYRKRPSPLFPFEDPERRASAT